MKRLLLIAMALAVLATVSTLWLYGTAAGREWRLSRLPLSDLLALALSNPQDVQAQRLLGERLMAEKRFVEAAGAFASAASAEPKSAWPLVRQGRALLDAGQPAEALMPLEEALRREPGRADALTALGEAHYALGNRVEALEKYGEAVKRDPTNARAWAGYAFPLADTHKHDAAREAAQKALRLEPQAGWAYTALGYAEDKAGNIQAAVEALTRAVERDAGDGRAWGMLASARTRLARTPEAFVEAADALAKADALLPDAPVVPYYRGLLLAAQRRHAEAAEAFRRALQRNPNFTDALYNLSISLAFAGQKRESAEARARFERAHAYDRDIHNLQLRIRRDPTRADLWRRMKRLAETHGDAERAQLAQQRLERLEP